MKPHEFAFMMSALFNIAFVCAHTTASTYSNLIVMICWGAAGGYFALDMRRDLKKDIEKLKKELEVK